MKIDSVFQNEEVKSVVKEIVEIEKKCESMNQEEDYDFNDKVQFAKEVFQTIKRVAEENEKVVEVDKIIEVEKIVEVIKPCSKCLESCKECAAKDEKLAELINYVKESYILAELEGI